MTAASKGRGRRATFTGGDWPSTHRARLLISFLQQRLGRGGLIIAIVAAGAVAGAGASVLATPPQSSSVKVPLPAMAAVSPAQHAMASAAPVMRPLAVSATAPLRNASAGARELECLTQAVYFEARGETATGQAAVAQVVLNRVRHPAFPKTVCGVVHQGEGRRGCQFSFICDGRAEAATERRAWSRAQQVAARALAGSVIPQVAGATHFHVAALASPWPGMVRVGQVGLHVFYRFAPRGSRQVQAQAAAPEHATLTALPLDPKPAEPAAQAEPSPPTVEPASADSVALDSASREADAS